MLDYEILRVLWWALMGILLIGFAVLDGFDLGTAILLPFVGKNDEERRILLNTVGPVWEGNQVWLLLGAGASFAAWPPLYGVAFSGFYLAMFLALFAIIVRPVAFKFRSKVSCSGWRTLWDWLLCLGGVIAAFVFGVAFGNLFLGVPFSFDDTLRPFYHGGFWGLLTPFPIVCGIACVIMMTLQGATFLSLKVQGNLLSRMRKTIYLMAPLMMLAFITIGVYAAYVLNGYTITSPINMAGPSNPLHKIVALEPGAWSHNFKVYPYLLGVPGITLLGLLLTPLFTLIQKKGMAFITSSLSIIGVVATCGVMLFPFLLPSSHTMGHSLTVWDASSSQMTLFVMLIAALIFVPIILGYTAWVYRVLRGPVTSKTLAENETNAY